MAWICLTRTQNKQQTFNELSRLIAKSKPHVKSVSHGVFYGINLVVFAHFNCNYSYSVKSPVKQPIKKR